MKNKILIGMLVVIISLGLLKGLSILIFQKTVETTITKTDRECKSTETGAAECRYMVYTPDEVFENVDSFMHFKFNSSDYNNKLLPGKTYKLTVYGWRIPLLSWYRNVINYEEINN